MKKPEGLCQIFKGWYRQSLTRKNKVWHRVYRVESILTDKQMAYTLCGRSIVTTKCDFDIKPDHRCLRCENPSGVTIITSGRKFLLIGSISIPTKTSAISELKRLLKPRIYHIRLWGIYGVRITAEWKSDVSIDIDTELAIITKHNKKELTTLEQIQIELDGFKCAIDCLCDATDVLALEEKRKKKLKGKLTESEGRAYFEKLLCEVEK